MTRYDFFRRRVAPVLFLGLIGVIALDTCRDNERTHATIVLDLGAAKSKVKSIDAELIVEGEVINTFHRKALGAEMGPCKFEVAMPAKDGELRIDADGRHLVRKIHAEEDAVVTVSLESDLLKP